MSEKSEVQNLTQPDPATEVLDPAPDAVDAQQVEDGEPKDYLRGTPAVDQVDDDKGYPTEERQGD